jgi:hypothetical protein
VGRLKSSTSSASRSDSPMISWSAPAGQGAAPISVGINLLWSRRHEAHKHRGFLCDTGAATGRRNGRAMGARAMSAVTPIATKHSHRSETPLCANRRLSASIWQGADLGAACTRGCIANIRIDAGKIHTSASLAISMRLRSSPSGTRRTCRLFG